MSCEWVNNQFVHYQTACWCQCQWPTNYISLQTDLLGDGSEGVLSSDGGAGHHCVAHHGQQHGEHLP